MAVSVGSVACRCGTPRMLQARVLSLAVAALLSAAAGTAHAQDAAPPELPVDLLRQSLRGLQLEASGDLVRAASMRGVRPAAGGEIKDAISLAEASELAAARSHALAASRARVEGAGYLASASWSGVLPRLELRGAKGRETSTPSSVLDPETSRVKPTDTHPRDEVYMLLTQPLVDLAAVSEIRRTRAVLAATQASLAGARDDAAYAVVSNYYGLVEGGLMLGLARERRERLTRLLARVTARAEAGGASGADRERIRGRVLAAGAAAEEAQGVLDQALITFGRLTGVVPGNVTLPGVTEQDMLLPLPAAAEAARQDNALVGAARANGEAARHERRSLQARFLPTLELQLSQNRVRNAGGVLGWQEDRRAMVVMSMPIFSGGMDYYRQRAVAAKEDQYHYELLDAQRNVDENLSLAYNALHASGAKLATVREQVAADTRVVEAFDAQLNGAGRSLLDVFDAYQQLYQSRTELIRASVAGALLHYQVLRVMGRLDTHLRAGAATAQTGVP